MSSLDPAFDRIDAQVGDAEPRLDETRFAGSQMFPESGLQLVRGVGSRGELIPNARAAAVKSGCSRSTPNRRPPQDMSCTSAMIP